jgi:hypothetical protein
MKFLGCLGVLLLTFAIAGCGGAGSEQDKMEEQAEQTPGTAEAPATTAEAPAAATATGMPVTLTGTTGCGHCTFGVATECVSAIKTATGEIYVIDGVAPDSDLFKSREEIKNIQLTGTVWKPEPTGVAHVKIESYQLN